MVQSKNHVQWEQRDSVDRRTTWHGWLGMCFYDNIYDCARVGLHEQTPAAVAMH
jgi:hypothetical protein